MHGKGGSDNVVVKQGDGMSMIVQILNGDTNVDTILFDAMYDDIEVVNDAHYFVLQAYKSNEDKYLAVKVICAVEINGDGTN